MFFIAKNDNIAGIKYKATTFQIVYRGVPIGRGTVPAFFQGAHSKKNVRATVFIDHMSLLQTDSDVLVQDIAVNDRVEFRVMGDVNAKIRIIGITSPSVQVISVYKVLLMFIYCCCLRFKCSRVILLI